MARSTVAEVIYTVLLLFDVLYRLALQMRGEVLPEVQQTLQQDYLCVRSHICQTVAQQ